MALSMSLCKAESLKKSFHRIAAMLLLSVVTAFLKEAGNAVFGGATSFDTLQAWMMTATSKMVGIVIYFFMLL